MTKEVQATRPGRHPLRRRLRRRHAADRRPVHSGHGVVRQRHVDPAELPGRDPRPRRHPAGCLGFQLHFADHDIMTPGDAPDVLVAMNPAALKANIADLPRGGTIIVDTDDFTNAQPGARSATTPTRSRTARSPTTRSARADLTAMTVEARQGVRPDPQGRRAGEEHVRARAAVLAVPPADRGHADVPRRRSSRKQARHPRRQHRRLQGRLELRRDHRGLRGHLRGQARPPMPAGTLPQHLRQPGAGATG